MVETITPEQRREQDRKRHWPQIRLGAKSEWQAVQAVMGFMLQSGAAATKAGAEPYWPFDLEQAQRLAEKEVEGWF
jgi:hypothetical protein